MHSGCAEQCDVLFSLRVGCFKSSEKEVPRTAAVITRRLFIWYFRKGKITASRIMS